METMTAIALVAGLCVLVVFIALLKRRSQALLNFLVRTVLGAICISFVNKLLASQGIALSVGLGPVSLLTSGTLGFGGVALLYAILACKFL